MEFFLPLEKLSLLERDQGEELELVETLELVCRA